MMLRKTTVPFQQHLSQCAHAYACISLRSAAASPSWPGTQGIFGERACGKGELAQGLLESRYVAGLCETARLVETKRFVTSPRIPRAVASARTARLPCCRPRDRFQYAKTATELRARGSCRFCRLRTSDPT